MYFVIKYCKRGVKISVLILVLYFVKFVVRECFFLKYIIIMMEDVKYGREILNLVMKLYVKLRSFKEFVNIFVKIFIVVIRFLVIVVI